MLNRKPLQNVVATFAEQLRKGKILSQLSSQTFTYLPRSLKPFDLPVFDFGYIADETDPAFLGASFTGSLTDQLYAKAQEALMSGTFRLPFDQCAFIHRWHETDESTRCVALHVLAQPDPDNILGQVFHYQPEIRAFKGSWTRLPLRYAITDKGRTIESEEDYRGARAEKLQSLFNLTTEMLVANMFLLERVDVIEADEALTEPKMKQVNTARACAGVPPLTVRVVVGRDRRVGRRGVGPGSTRCPHDRRGHTRRLKSGKVVNVRASAIHGGSDRQRIWEVSR